MKKKEWQLALERFVGTALANGERERRRTDEAMARIARLERYTQALESALERVMLGNADRDDRIAELEAGRVDTEAALFRTGETVADLVAGLAVLRARVAELERRIGAEGQVSESDGTWWYDDNAATYTVAER